MNCNRIHHLLEHSSTLYALGHTMYEQAPLQSKQRREEPTKKYQRQEIGFGGRNLMNYVLCM